MNSTDRIRIQQVEVLSDDWFILKKTTFDYLRKDGTWQRQSRETYDRGNGATILLYNKLQKTVILIRQFRFPAYVNGHHGWLIESVAGLLDDKSPEDRIREETQEETGLIVHKVHKIFDAYMSPGSVTEKVHFFVAEYEAQTERQGGGGVISEGEEIEVIEMPLDVALNGIQSGEIADGKTIMLLLYAKLYLFNN